MRNLRYKYRLIIINDDTFEEQFSLKLSLLNIITWVGSIVFVVTIGVSAIMAFTPLREYIPGYSNIETRQNARYAKFKSDSLANEIVTRDLYLYNLMRVISGEIDADSISDIDLEDIQIDDITDTRSKEDSLMRLSVEEQEQYALHNVGAQSEVGVYFFFNPISGEVTNSFDSKKGHFGVDVVSSENEPIKAVMDGTIVMADYTTKSGYVIQIQHQNNLVSIYKHCSAVLKNSGEKVLAGDPIAVVGNTGEHTTGPHLHFELWENGVPIDPQKHIIF